MKRRRPMTKEDHIELANAFANLDHHINIIENMFREFLEPDTRIRENFSKLAFLNLNGIFVDIFGDLEDYYNDVIIDEEYTGPLYVDFKDKYEKLQSAR